MSLSTAIMQKRDGGMFNECLRHEDNSLCANLKKNCVIFVLPAAEKQRNVVMNDSVYAFILVHSRTLVWQSSLCQKSTVSA